MSKGVRRTESHPVLDRSRNDLRTRIAHLAARMMAEDGMTPAENDAIVARARAKVDEAIDFGRQSAYPAPAEAMEKVFA